MVGAVFAYGHSVGCRKEECKGWSYVKPGHLFEAPCLVPMMSIASFVEWARRAVAS
jgi:hypothetical protein